MNDNANDSNNNTIELVIDTREHELIERLQKKSQSIKIEQMEIGDILFRNKDETFLIIERKTINDLKASICDGRGREQKARLLGNVSRDRIVYLIEGNIDKTLESKISGLPVSTLLGSLINTQLRDGIKVYKTSSIQETVEYIVKLYEKLQKEHDNFFNYTEKQDMSSAEYSSTIKKSKKANMTPEVWFISMLSLIPQVTEKVSDVIVNKYHSVNILMVEYEKTPEHLRGKLLADLTYELKTGKIRRIGDKISTRVYNFFYGITIIDTKTDE